MEIKRENNIIDSECDNETIYQISVIYFGNNKFFSDNPYISITYDDDTFYDKSNLSPPILDKIIYEYNAVIYRSKNKESLKFQENKMLKKLQEIIKLDLDDKKEQIIRMEKDIKILVDAYDTLNFRKEKIKKLLK